MSYNINVDQNGPATQEELDNTFVYPNCAILSEGPVSVSANYPDFAGTLFSIYYTIYSKEEGKDYVLCFSALNLSGTGQDVIKMVYFDNLQSDEYKHFMQSMALIFGNYKRHIFDMRGMGRVTLGSFLNTIENWEPIKKEGEI